MGVLDPVLERMLHNGDRALEQIGAHLAGESSREAPIREGFLRADAHWTLEDTGNGHYVVVYYTLVYAARQHEELDWEHPRGGKAKFLEDPLKANALRYERIMDAAITHPDRLA